MNLIVRNKLFSSFSSVPATKEENIIQKPLYKYSVCIQDICMWLHAAETTVIVSVHIS